MSSRNTSRLPDISIRAMQNQIDNFKAELKNGIHSSMQNQIKNVKNELRSDISSQTNEPRNMMASFFQKNTASTSGSGLLPSNTIANPMGDLKAITTRSGVPYDRPLIPPPTSSLPKVVEQVPEVTKDTVQPSTENIQPLVVETKVLIDDPFVALKPKPTIPYLSRANKQKLREKDDNLALKFVEIFRNLHFNLSFADALLHMPKFSLMFKSLLNNKEKLFDLATTLVNENCSAVILKKLPEKLGDPGKFLIPCDFPELDECLALADLGGGDFILEEIDACLTSKSIPLGINDTNFDLEGDIHLLEELLNNDPSSSPIPPKELNVEEIKMVKSSIDEPPELELKELPSYLEYAFLEGTDKLLVIISKELKDEEKSAFLKVLKSHKQAIAWKIFDIKGIDPPFCTHKILMEYDFKPTVQHQRRVNPKIHKVIKKEVIKLLDARLIYPISDSPWVSPVHCVPKKGGMTVVENEDNELIPTRCMMAIFHDMIEKTMEVFMDDFSVFGDSFSSCLSHLDQMLKRCEDTNLVLNWKKCHFMVKEGIFLGHIISKFGIEVERAKVDVIAKLPHPTFVKDTMADQRTMAELLRAPTEVYTEAIVVSLILAEQSELKHSLINMMTSDQFFGLKKDNPHDHIRAARRCLEKEPPRSILTWEDLVSKFINEFFPSSRTTNLRKEISNFQQRFDESFHKAWDRYKYLLRACPRHGFTELHQLDTFYNALNPADQDSLNSVAGGNLLEIHTQDVLTIIENKSKVRNYRNKLVVSQVKSSDANSNSSFEIAKLTHAVNQQTSAVTTAVTTILKQFQATPPPASVKAVEEICVTCAGAHPYYQCLIAGLGSLPSTTIANPKGELKAITTPSGIVFDGPFVPIPPPFINLKEDERVDETLTDQDLAEYTIKVPPPIVQKSKAHSQRNYIVHQRDPLHPNIPYPSRMLKQKQQEKDKVQIHKFWQMFKQLHINITLADALILIPKYQKMLKALLSNKEKLLELANTPLNENPSAVILKKLPKKLGDPRKFLISYSFSEHKCKALVDLGASINLMPLFVWKKLGLPELISTRMTLELANRAICTPDGIARDVFVLVGKFTLPADFVIVDYESDPRVPLILGRPFLRTARALIDVHGEEMILRDGDERLTLNMRHDTLSYLNQPQKESINMINICDNSSEDFLENLFSTNHQSGNPTFSSHQKITSPKVKNDVFDPDQVLKPLFPSPIPLRIATLSWRSLNLLFLCLNTRLLSIIRNRRVVAVPLLMLITLFLKSRVHVPNVLTTHPTLMLDSDFIPSDNSLPEYKIFYFDIEENNSGSTTIHADISLLDLESFYFDFKSDLGELTSIVDSKICKNILSTTNVNFPPEEDHSPLFRLCCMDLSLFSHVSRGFSKSSLF
uniref:DNA-directed DNA polymerase n=1 Tax=Tanacetum cinerariifolium TaxID=118510 RepID=A0A6L2P643_TANCI|nr:DNA-directed DNA polymerase [Tanacetum cinerariifolium]